MGLQARLRPYDPSKGFLRQGLHIVSISMAFDAGVIVTDITPHVAKVLRVVRQRDEDPQCQTPLAFDVLEEEEMRALVASEARQKLGLTPEVMSALRAEIRDEVANPTPAPIATPKPRRTRGAQVNA